MWICHLVFAGGMALIYIILGPICILKKIAPKEEYRH